MRGTDVCNLAKENDRRYQGRESRYPRDPVGRARAICAVTVITSQDTQHGSSQPGDASPTKHFQYMNSPKPRRID